MIEVKDIVFSYRKRLALNKISIEIPQGDSVAIIGPNGSGKSTFLKIINGISFPNEGAYIFHGEAITEKKLQNDRFCKLFHKRIGFVFQNSDTQLFCPTVYDEIAFGPRQMGLKEEEISKRTNDCMKMLEINQLENEAPYNLSGGEKKRVAIASVLAMNPEVLTLDEPMGGIDPKGKRFLRELLILLNKSGKTIICATHDFEYVSGVFKRAIVLSDKHSVLRDGSYDEIINDKEFLKQNNII